MSEGEGHHEDAGQGGMPGLVDWDLRSTLDDPKTTLLNDARFEGKCVVITGAGGQFGREGCIYYLKRGASVAALDRSQAGLKETFDAILNEFGGETGHCDFTPYVCDVTDAEQVAEVVEAVAVRFGNIDFLWNNAGYQGKIKTLLNYDPADFEMVMNVNVTGMFIVMQAVARQMAKQRSKQQGERSSYSIVNTASVAGLRCTPAMIAYASSKAAVLAMTVTASKDLAPEGIRVNAVSPALIGPGFMWDRQNKLHSKSGSPYFSTDEKEVARNKVNSVPMKRLGSVEEVIKVVSFLFSDESSYMTGSNMVVDGGMAGGLKA